MCFAIEAVSAIVGVEDVDVSETIALTAEPVTSGGQIVITYIEQPTQTVTVRYNRLNVTPDQIASSIEGAGFQVNPYSDLSQVGQSIIIPPKPVG